MHNHRQEKKFTQSLKKKNIILILLCQIIVILIYRIMISTFYLQPLEGTLPSACCSLLAQDMSSSLATVCSRELTEPRSWSGTVYTGKLTAALTQFQFLIEN